MKDETKNKIKALAITGAAVYLAWKFGKSQAVKAAALGVAGVMVVNQIPVVKNGLSA